MRIRKATRTTRCPEKPRLGGFASKRQCVVLTLARLNDLMSTNDDTVRVMIRCPVSGESIPTGLVADPKTWDARPIGINRVSCPVSLDGRGDACLRVGSTRVQARA